MSLTDWDAFREINESTYGISDPFGNFPLSIINRYVIPRTDIYQTDKKIIIKSEVPGLSMNDMEILIENSYIRLSGQKKRNNTWSNEEIFHSEQFYGSFSRIIPLPSEVQPDKAVSEYKDGILSIIIPKSEAEPTVSQQAGGL